MNWFRKTGDRSKGTSGYFTVRPSTLPECTGLTPKQRKPSDPFNFFLFIFLAFLAGLFLLKAGIPQSVPVSFSDVRPLKVEPKADSDRNPDPDARFTRPGSRLSESERRDRAESERRDSSGGAMAGTTGVL
jgi:hypothetical protein